MPKHLPPSPEGILQLIPPPKMRTNCHRALQAQLRIIEIDGKPWFRATDVCKCVGLSTKGGTRQHMLKLDPDQKQTVSRNTHNRIVGVSKFVTQAPSARVVSESGLYRLIMRADGAASKPFRDWVMGEA